MAGSYNTEKMVGQRWGVSAFCTAVPFQRLGQPAPPNLASHALLHGKSWPCMPSMFDMVPGTATHHRADRCCSILQGRTLAVQHMLLVREADPPGLRWHTTVMKDGSWQGWRIIGASSAAAPSGAEAGAQARLTAPAALPTSSSMVTRGAWSMHGSPPHGMDAHLMV